MYRDIETLSYEKKNGWIVFVEQAHEHYALILFVKEKHLVSKEAILS